MSEPRALVRWFGRVQERKFAEHDSKGEWDGMSFPLLFWLLLVEVAELGWAIATGAPGWEVDDEAADVANYALILTDKYKGAAGSRDRGRIF